MAVEETAKAIGSRESENRRGSGKEQSSSESESSKSEHLELICKRRESLDCCCVYFSVALTSFYSLSSRSKVTVEPISGGHLSCNAKRSGIQYFEDLCPHLEAKKDQPRHG